MGIASHCNRLNRLFSVDSLRRLHLKHRALDSYRDDRSDRVTSVRKAWREVGDNAERGKRTL